MAADFVSELIFQEYRVTQVPLESGPKGQPENSGPKGQPEIGGPKGQPEIGGPKGPARN
jgi:hypothetical protein